MMRPWFAVAAIACWMALEATSLIAADVTLDDIAAQWQAREAQCASLRLEWDDARFFSKGRISDRPLRPPKDTVIQYKRSLLFDSGRIRIVDRGEYGHGDHGFAPAVRTNVWNGAEARTLHHITEPLSNKEVELLDIGNLAIERVQGFGDAQFRPPQLACWPLTAGKGIKLDDYRITATTPMIILQRPRRDGPEAELWLQSEPPFLIVRTISYISRFRQREIEINYDIDSQHRHYPISWNNTSFDGDGISGALQATLTSHDFSPMIDKDTFQLDFPPNAWVHDNTDPKKPRQFLQRKDGTRRYILDEERGASYKDLIETESGMARPRPK